MESYIQQSPSHKTSDTIMIVAAIIIIGCIVAVLIGKHLNNPYQAVNNTPNYTERQIMTKRESESLSPKLEIDFYYLKGCHHCNSVAKVAVPGIRHARQFDNTLVMNAAPKSLHAYLRRNRVYGYPTVAVRYHGYLIYEYTGMNKHIFKKVFNGINPYTKEPFRHQVPDTTYRYNSYTQRLIKEPPLSLSSSQVQNRQR